MEHEGQQSTGQERGSTASKAIESLQHEAAELTQAAKRASSQMLEQRVDKVFSVLDDIESAVRAAARELQNEEHPLLAQYVNRAADEVAHTRSRFGTTDVNGMISTAEHLARTRPVATLGLAFAVGFAFVRLLKSSTPELSESRSPGRYSTDGDDADVAFDTVKTRRSSYASQSSGQSYGGQSRGSTASPKYSGGESRQRRSDRDEGRDDE